MYLLILEEELKFFKVLASHTDLISGNVESISVFVLSTRLVISQHTVATLHGQNFVVDSTIVSVLISEIIQLLSEFSNQLVLFSTANGDSASGVVSLLKEAWLDKEVTYSSNV